MDTRLLVYNIKQNVFFINIHDSKIKQSDHDDARDIITF